MQVRKLLLVLASTLVGLSILEVVSRRQLPDGYFVWPPGWQATFDPAAGIRGIEGPSHLTVNSLGLRGDEIGAGTRYRMIAIGGSTTICTRLDDREAWPYAVQERLNATLGAGTAWVGNAGRPGHATPQHVLQVEKLLETLPRIDAVIVLAGANDMLIALTWGLEPKRALGSAGLDPLDTAFALHPAEGRRWWRRTGIGRWLAARQDWLGGAGRGPVMDARTAEWVNRARALRRTARQRDDLPDLSAALASYRKGLRRIARQAARHGARVLFVSQPSLWREELPEEELASLWTGGPPLGRQHDHAVFWGTAALERALDLYNEAMRRACGEERVECIDAAASLPKTGEIFWDDLHFTEEGARRMADLVAGHLLATDPLAGWVSAGSRP
jgi:lysophospholipase L1-like esterase